MSDQLADVETTTETRTSVESEKVTLYQCPGPCEQHVERDELVPITIGDDEVLETVVCEYCARSQYDWDGDASKESVAERLGSAADSFADVVAIPLLKAVGPLLVVGGVAAITFGEMIETLQTVPSGEFATGAPLVVPEAAILISIFVVGIVVFTALRMVAIGRRL